MRSAASDRIAYMIDDGRLVILVVEVGHRREIYRRHRGTVPGEGRTLAER
ncbi:MAG: hypothetical protein HOY79_50495 [Streptomyces sp.]|nr:hypothetical protein [Streptomyces sp.]